MSEQVRVHHSPALRLLAPLSRPTFRTLWAGMGLSYAGDRLQELAQGWLVATLTGSALAVGGIGVLSAIPMLLMPLGGAVADRADRRRIILAGQITGALVTGIMAALAFSDRITVWHIYLWALVSGMVWMVVRPAYKVIITQAVPADEVRPAVSLNSITETVAQVLMNAGGSAVLAWLGLPLAFILNSLSYLVAALCLWRLRGLGRVAKRQSSHLLAEMRDGFRYLAAHKGLLYPLLLTFGGITIIGPTTSLLPAIVQASGGTIVQLGLLAAAGSLGALLGAVFAGATSEKDPLRTYPVLGLIAAAAATIFVLRPLGVTAALALCVLGFAALAQVVWNTSRVPRLAEPAYQARMQSITSMTFTLGAPLGAIWGGAAIDRFGLRALVGGAAVLALISLAVLVRSRTRVAALAFGEEGAMSVEPWITHDWLRRNVEYAAPAIDFIRHNPGHPIVRSLYPGNTLAQMLAFWDERGRYFDALDRLPQVYCHQDAFRRNLFAQSEGLVIIDWGYAGIAPVGAELASLVNQSASFRAVPFSQLRELDRLCFEGYMQGLRDAGWDGAARLVRLGQTVYTLLRFVIGSVGELLPALLDDDGRAHYAVALGRPAAEIERTDPAHVAYLQALVMEAFRLLGIGSLLRFAAGTARYALTLHRGKS